MKNNPGKVEGPRWWNRLKKALSSPIGVRKMPAKAVDVLYTHLAYFVKNNLPIVAGLEASFQEIQPSPDRSKVVFRIDSRGWQIPPSAEQPMKTLIGRLRQGASLADALKEARAGSASEIAILRFAEANGTLDECLPRLAERRREKLMLRRQIFGTLIYPFTVAFVVGGQMLAVMFYIAPRLEKILVELDLEPHFLLAPLFALSARLRALVASTEFWLYLAGAALCGIVFWRGFPIVRHWLAVHLPVLRGFSRLRAAVETCGDLSDLLRVRLPAPVALEAVAASQPNRIVGRRLAKARESVDAGRTLAEAVRQVNLLPSSLRWVIAGGIRSDALPDALDLLRRRYKAALERRVNMLTQVIEPFGILTLAAFVGALAAGVLLTILSISNLLL